MSQLAVDSVSSSFVMSFASLFLAFLVPFGVSHGLGARSVFLEVVRNSSIVHHKQTNTVWEYIGTYGQTENTVNLILEIPVFQFMCDVFPVSMAFAMKACTQYRTRVLEQGSARRLNELVEDHLGKRRKRQIAEVIVGGTAIYGVYKIVGDLLKGSNDEIIHRLDENENFQKHQEKLDDVLVTSILSLEDRNLMMLKNFKNLFDSVNVTRSLVHSLLQMSFKEQKLFTGWAKFSLKSEMRRHYEQMINAFTRTANHDINMDMFSPEQRTFTHEFLWNRVQPHLPLNFSISLAQFIPSLLIQQIVTFSEVDETKLVYELQEEDFHFVVEADSSSPFIRNETVDLDSILPKIVGHARIENFFGIPTDRSKKTTHMYKITRLPLFVNEKTATYTANIPQYLTLDEDGASAEWSEHKDRKCTMDDQSKFMFCSVPVPKSTIIQNPCLRSIVLNNSTKDCLKESVPLSAPFTEKLAPNLHAISVHTPLQCFEKGEKGRQNIFSNITRIAFIKTRCNSFVSCGTIDFSSLGVDCNTTDTYILTLNHTHENLLVLDKSVNSIEVDLNNLTELMDMSSLIQSTILNKNKLEMVHTDFHQSAYHAVQREIWPKFVIGSFGVGFLLALSFCLMRWVNFTEMAVVLRAIACCHIVFRRLRKTYNPVEIPSNSPTADGISTNEKTFYHDMGNIGTRAAQYQPFLKGMAFGDPIITSPNRIVCDNNQMLLGTQLQLSQLPTRSGLYPMIDGYHLSKPRVMHKKPIPIPRKIYVSKGEVDGFPSNESRISVSDFFEEDGESED